MKKIEPIFFDLFWRHKSCQNLFLLSKEEFLDTKAFTFGENPVSISFPRIILSNIESKEDYTHSKIKIRTESYATSSEALIKRTFERYEPLIKAFIESKFGESIALIVKDFSENPMELISEIIMSLFSSDEEIEKCIIGFLHKYKLVGYHITTFKQLGEYIETEGVNKNLRELVSEQNMWAVLELAKSFKDRYVTEIYKSLHNSNQILVSSFHEMDNYADRIKLFSMLYDAQIIKPSSEDSFIECTSCEPNTYRGVFTLKINPEQLKKIKCPICNTSVTYYVPYELNKVIYNIVKEKDGLLLKALDDKLKRNKIRHTLNKTFLTDIEIDCLYAVKKKVYVVETKMYKQNTTPKKLQSKLKEHFAKLVNDTERICAADTNPDPEEDVYPLLLVNIHDKKLLEDTMLQLKEKNKRNVLFQKGRIITINEVPLK
jgi:hypothetical protein